ncbi:HNH endonuclease [Marivirga tractuosa]|uniref:HNH endonuclease n=1 Tax=Marivirga tractuosa TaxID=1006 RepID=UPI0035D09D25
MMPAVGTRYASQRALLDGLTSVQKTRLKELYQNMPLPNGRPSAPSFTFSKTIDGFGDVTITYDKFGFPKFDDFMKNRKVFNNAGQEVIPRFPGPLKGTNGGDLGNATDWALQNFPADKVRRTPSAPGKRKKTTIDIKDESGEWITHTWHHHQNGKDLFPVPSKIHNASDGGFAHSGGDSILRGDEDNLIGIFNDPTF